MLTGLWNTILLSLIVVPLGLLGGLILALLAWLVRPYLPRIEPYIEAEARERALGFAVRQPMQLQQTRVATLAHDYEELRLELARLTDELSRRRKEFTLPLQEYYDDMETYRERVTKVRDGLEPPPLPDYEKPGIGNERGIEPLAGEIFGNGLDSDFTTEHLARRSLRGVFWQFGSVEQAVDVETDVDEDAKGRDAVLLLQQRGVPGHQPRAGAPGRRPQAPHAGPEQLLEVLVRRCDVDKRVEVVNVDKVDGRLAHPLFKRVVDPVRRAVHSALLSNRFGAASNHWR